MIFFSIFFLFDHLFIEFFFKGFHRCPVSSSSMLKFFKRLINFLTLSFQLGLTFLEILNCFFLRILSFFNLIARFFCFFLCLFLEFFQFCHFLCNFVDFFWVSFLLLIKLVIIRFFLFPPFFFSLQIFIFDKVTFFSFLRTYFLDFRRILIIFARAVFLVLWFRCRFLLFTIWVFCNFNPLESFRCLSLLIWLFLLIGRFFCLFFHQLFPRFLQGWIDTFVFWISLKNILKVFDC